MSECVSMEKLACFRKRLAIEAELGNQDDANPPLGKRDRKMCHRHSEGNGQARCLTKERKAALQKRRLKVTSGARDAIR